MDLLLFIYFVVLICVGQNHCNGNIQTILEGKNLFYQCKGEVTPKKSIYWESKTSGFYQNGPQLQIPGITRKYTGNYKCMEQNLSTNKSKELDTVDVDVIYPAKILSTQITEERLSENKTFHMTATVEGNPIPDTQLIQANTESVMFDTKEQGILTISFTVTCSDRDEREVYILTCGNDLNTSQQKFNLTVLCVAAPDPAFPLNLTVTPRLGETALLEAHVKAYPQPTFRWWKGDTELTPHTDTDFSTQLLISPIHVDNYGPVTLKMLNEAGESIFVYDIKATGPPEPVTNFQIKSFASNNATLIWTTGFDYNSTQVFVVVNYKNGVVSEIQSFEDEPHDPGNREREETLLNLEPIMQYNITILARNDHGNASGTPVPSSFITLGAPRPSTPPKDSFSPRIGENIELQISCLSNPLPTFSWTFNDQPIDHTDSEQSSVVYLNGIKSGDFGNYILVVKNSVGEYTHQYGVNAEGPPDIAYDLEVGRVTSDSAELSWFPGFDYRAVQTFTVTSEQGELAKIEGKLGDMEKVTYTVYQLVPGTAYALRIKSSNSRGNAANLSNMVQFTTEAPDPTPPPQPTRKPRSTATVFYGNTALVFLLLLLPRLILKLIE